MPIVPQDPTDDPGSSAVSQPLETIPGPAAALDPLAAVRSNLLGYEIRSQIAEGVHGEVYLIQALDRSFHALKVFRRERFAVDGVDLYDRMFHAMVRYASLCHQVAGHMKIVEVIRPNDDFFYYVVDLADDAMRGRHFDSTSYTPRSLSTECAHRGPIPLAECSQIVIQLTHALESLHRQGLIHRGIKTSNILFLDGKLMLAEPGVLTVTESAVTGMEDYAAPEGTASFESDVYSLGKVLHEMATGSTTGSFVVEESSAQDPLVAGFQEILQKACDPHPHKRYHSPAELRLAIELLLHRGSADVAKLAAADEAPVSQARTKMALLAVAALALAGAFYYLGRIHNVGASRFRPVLVEAKEIKPPEQAPETTPPAGQAMNNQTESRSEESAAPPDPTPAPPPAIRPIVPASSSTLGSVVAQPLQSQPGAFRWTNSLHMPFVPVPGTPVLFCIWDVRVQDFAAFTQQTGRFARSPDFAQDETHPVCGVDWVNADVFCQWLTAKEHQERVLQPHLRYRLPTDAEWSVAVGLGAEPGRTPSEKSSRVKNVFPWGLSWPPAKGVGNYNPSLGLDDYTYTSPVGSFAPNGNGLYDMGGNVWQWCADYSDYTQRSHPLRGGSWRSSRETQLRASARISKPSASLDDVGFRIVIARN